MWRAAFPLFVSKVTLTCDRSGLCPLTAIRISPFVLRITIIHESFLEELLLHRFLVRKILDVGIRTCTLYGFPPEIWEASVDLEIEQSSWPCAGYLYETARRRCMRLD